jgi:dynein heavy chain
MTALNEGLSALQSFERWSRHQDISKYIDVLEEWDDKVAQDTEEADSRYLNPQDMIDTTENSTYRSTIKTLLERFFFNTCMFIEENF